MALASYYLTVRLQQHSSAIDDAVIAETTSVNATFTAEALEDTCQDDGLVSTFVVGKNKVTISGDYLLASDGDQFDYLLTHANSGDKISVGLYRDGDLILTSADGVFTSISLISKSSPRTRWALTHLPLLSQFSIWGVSVNSTSTGGIYS